MKAKALRNSILMMALQGKLVAQDSHDEPAIVLLEKIRAEKAELIKQKKIKKEKPLPDITEEEKPSDLPIGWKWVRLGNIVSILSDGIHGTPRYTTDGEYYFVNGNNLLNGQITVKDNTKRVEYSEFEKHKKSLDEETTVLVSINGTLGNIAFYQNEKIILGKSACYFNLLGNVEKKYIAQVIKSKYFVDYAFFIATGTTIKNVSLRAMKMFLVPLPPLAEQQRIVAKLEELRLKVDEYERAETALTSFEQEFPDKMRSSILQAAVKGKLVAQNPKDESAFVLLEKIRAEKAELIKQKKIKKEKPLPEITDEEKPFDLPDGWEWVRLGDICNYIQRGKSPKYSSIVKYPVISQKCNQWEGFFIDRAKFIDPETITSYGEERFLQNGDLLWNSTGLGTVGRMAMYKSNSNKYDLVVADSHVTIVRTLKKYINVKYIFFWIACPEVQLNIDKITSGSTKQKELSTDTIKKILFPLPPLNEQEDIVAKVEEMLSICDRLQKA